MKILVTGGAGFIGSHTLVELLKAGHEAVVFDNFSNSDASTLKAVETITGKPVPYVEGDLLNQADLDRVFAEHAFDAVIHFAAKKAVGESVLKPVEYYENNVGGSVNLLKAMDKAGVTRIVFSSSATVYGEHNTCPYNETMPKEATNPYGWTKVMMEEILSDWARVPCFTANAASSGEACNQAQLPTRHVILLRYFNPVGAHESGLIGENPRGIPNNLMPLICRAAMGGAGTGLTVTGSDFDTPDGTGVRDYIHVCDLAYGHEKALEHLDQVDGVEIYNLGRGKGVSVLELIRAFEEANGVKVPHTMGPRRPGDVAWSYADCSKAERELGWKATRGPLEMCRDSWQFIMRRQAK